ncbi:elongator complex protein 3 [Oscillospiraceae bacterium LTW-04]|nr:radical SAM protein [Oscillospiraceae bacterium MB24-C1]
MSNKHGNLAVFVPHIGCPHRCSFCDQRIISGAQNAPTPQDVTALCESALARNTGRDLELAFFGGSFTAIDRDYICALLEAAGAFVGKGICGIRLSTRPDAVGEEVLSLLKTYPVTAIELGAQSMNDAVLLRNERGHTAQDVVDASARIRRFGFELGLQMMIGLDGETEQDSYGTAQKLMACYPDTVRIYPALVLKGTELAKRLAVGAYRPLTLEEGIQRTARVMELFEKENSDIRIIRVGLHPSTELEQKLVAGPYHPAFRELCESRLMLGRLLKALEGVPTGNITVGVHPQDISRMTGQRRCNLIALAERGYIARVIPEETVTRLRPELL